ncbi:hypothetical protein V6N12_020457 [Hibiscus sabdariffa]|uniref:Uncharacterized protein n=1 Tax=Hibiscus sabdariffa TaxID=183260 RepID=A0ABR2CYR5_9ROSI
MGVQFVADDETVLKRLVDLETEIGEKQNVLKSLKGRNFGKIEIAASRGAAGGLIVMWDPAFFICESNVITDHAIILAGKWDFGSQADHIKR